MIIQKRRTNVIVCADFCFSERKKGRSLNRPLIITSVKLFSAVLLVELINTSACIKEHLLAACVERMAL